MHTKSAGVDAALLLWNVYIGSTMVGMCVSMCASAHVCVSEWANSVVYKRKKKCTALAHFRSFLHGPIVLCNVLNCTLL